METRRAGNGKKGGPVNTVGTWGGFKGISGLGKIKNRIPPCWVKWCRMIDQGLNDYLGSLNESRPYPRHQRTRERKGGVGFQPATKTLLNVPYQKPLDRILKRTKSLRPQTARDQPLQGEILEGTLIVAGSRYYCGADGGGFVWDQLGK